MFKKLFLYYCVLVFCISCKQVEKQKLTDEDSFQNYEEILNKENFLDSLYNETTQNKNDSLTRAKFLKIAARYDWLEKDDKFKRTIEHTYQLALDQKDTSDQARALWYWGDYYDRKQVLDSAYHYYIKAEKLYTSQKDSIQQARMLLYKAGVLYNMGIYTESEVATIQSINILPNKGDTRLLYEANLLMTLILKNFKDFKAVEKYYAIIPSLLNQLEKEGYNSHLLQRSWLSFQNNVGDFYHEINDPTSAKLHFESALNNESIDQFPKLKGMLLCNYANSQMQFLNDNSFIDSLLNLSLKVRYSINHKQGIADSKIRKAEFELVKKDTANAILTMREAYEMALHDKSSYELIESLKFLSEHDNLNKEFYLSTYLRTQDSLYNIERQTRNKFARIAYETEEVERNNSLLIERITYLIGVIALISGLSIAVFIVFKLRLKNRKLLHQQQEQQAVQQIQELIAKQQKIAGDTKNQERIRIAKDLHDAIINRIFTTRINLEDLPSTNEDQKKKLLDQLKQTENQIRTIAHDLHDNLFNQKEDFTEVLKDLVLSQKNDFNTTFDFPNNTSINWSGFSMEQKTQVYLILQELLQNVNKHSQASRCFAFFIQDKDKITIRLHDNGVGFKTAHSKKGMGMNNIQHRLKAINGKISNTRTENWTVFTITITINS